MFVQWFFWKGQNSRLKIRQKAGRIFGSYLQFVRFYFPFFSQTSDWLEKPTPQADLEGGEVGDAVARGCHAQNSSEERVAYSRDGLNRQNVFDDIMDPVLLSNSISSNMMKFGQFCPLMFRGGCQVRWLVAVAARRFRMNICSHKVVNFHLSFFMDM